MGGGEGATVREILRHPSVRRVTMVDIDGEVVDFCKNYLTEWHQGTLAHPKTRLIIERRRKFVLETRRKIRCHHLGFADARSRRARVHELYTIEFYRQMVKALRPGGVFIAQAGSGSLAAVSIFTRACAVPLKKLFKVVRPFYAFVPSFDVPWAFLLGQPQGPIPNAFAARVE